MASGVSVLNHFGAIRIEPRLGVPGETNVDGSWYARQTSLEIFKTKMLHMRDRSLPMGELILRTIRTSDDAAGGRRYFQNPAARDGRAQFL
ncbi:hypothetical protein X729_24945 [Mesorhizobium sp. L103C131B0]|nr:hypothetical protein X729_24945 [Mesorhizobium sp. L103C131B0]